MSSKVIIGDVCEYYDLNERLLLQLGLWPYQEKFEKFLRTFIVNVSLLVAFLVEFYRFYISDFDIKSIIEESQIFITLLSASYCYYNAIFQFELLKKLLDHIIFDYNHISNKQEIIIMQKYAKENKRFILGILLSFYLYVIILIFPSASHVVLYITGVVNDTQLTLPITIDTILFDKRSFYIIFFIQLFILWIITTVAIVNFTTFLLFLSHACALLSILIFKIGQPLKKNSHELSYKWSSIATCDAYNWIKDIVTHHVNVTEFIDLLNDLCENIYLIEMIFSMLCIIIDYICISDLIKNTNEAFLYIIYIGASVITFYLHCYVGQRLLDHNAVLLESLSQISFYEFPIKYQKDLSILLIRSIKPCVISFRGMYIISNDFFARVIHTSLSYAMVYHNM